ncbi:MAG: hypothetical protein JXM70_00295 [Pirellulales bacterium]|nr:hypothetical protein [Pirellulales bacterium]
MTPFVTITEDGIAREPISRGDYTVTDGTHAQAFWLPEIFEQLRVIASLPEGWDSYGAPTPEFHKVEAAANLISCLADDPNLPKPYVNPTRDGGVQFEWESEAKYFELEIKAERAATFFYSDEDKHIEETGEVFENESLAVVLELIHRVVSNT